MLLRHLFEDKSNTAVASFGRLNPPTTGHNAMVDELKKVPGDHFLFLSHSQGAKNPEAKPGTKAGENKDPLSFSEKLPLVKQAFPDVNVGYADVTKIFDMPVKLYKLGYKKLVVVAGSDRMSSYKNIFPKFNGKEEAHGYYKFDSIEFVELTRDEEAEGVTGMSASKLRQAVRDDDFESFKTGLIAGNPQQLFDTIKERLAVDSIGIKQEPKQDPVDENINEYAVPIINAVRTVSPFAWKGIKWVGRWMKGNPKSTLAIGSLPWTGPILSTMAGIFGFLVKYHIPIGVAVTLLTGGKALWELLKDKDPDSVTEEELKEILKKYEPKKDADLEELQRRLEKATGKKLNDIKENINISEYSVRQQLPKIEVLNNIASRKDNTPFPLSYKNTGGASSGGQVYVSPETARKFIGFYEKRSPDEQELMQKALKSVSGVKNLFNNLSLTIDIKMDPRSENIPSKNPLDDLLGE